MSDNPSTRDEIVAALARQESEGAVYWDAFDTPPFFDKIGTSWSPAETVRHLTKGIRPVVKALTIPRLFLRLRFGKPRRPSMSYDELQTRYLKALADGGQAGRYAPSPRSEEDLEAWRHSIMSDFAGANHALRAAIARWRDEHLDHYQLPHPILGNLTVREILFFMLYHQRHHIAVVERRRAEAGV